VIKNDLLTFCAETRRCDRRHCQATKWQNHSIRGFISGHVTKKMGLVVESSKNDAGELYLPDREVEYSKPHAARKNGRPHVAKNPSE